MPKFSTIFFDRDGTLSQISPKREKERSTAIGKLVVNPDFVLTEEFHMNAFWRIFKDPKFAPVDTLEREKAFWHGWYEQLLKDQEYSGNAKTAAAQLYNEFCFHRMMEPFPETVDVLEVCAQKGLRMGVISDTFPSLEESLKSMGLAKYFESFTASSLVGVGKPDPKIFNAALGSLGVKAEESIFVDDCKKEADGAREQGFASFFLDRDHPDPDWENWTIGNLGHLLDFMEANG